MHEGKTRKSSDSNTVFRTRKSQLRSKFWAGSSGVWGHDHLLAAPPSPPVAGGDFNIAWLPVIVLFTNSAAANTHITKLDQLNTELADHNVEEIPVPSGTFHCNVVSAVTYNMGTPVPTAAPTP